MAGMPLTLSASEIALRLALTVLAGVLYGYNRSEHGKAAGMRTTLLVCLAASVAMIQVNLLLPTAGKPPHSFITNDLMRLPLGILTGVGFIGGGAILRRDNIVVGVTTAATLWMVTVIGLCLGGGQIGLGMVATVLGLAGLLVLGRIERRLPREQRARLSLELGAEGPGEGEIRRRLAAADLAIAAARVSRNPAAQRQTLDFELRWVRRAAETEMPGAVDALAREAGVVAVHWEGPL